MSSSLENTPAPSEGDKDDSTGKDKDLEGNHKHSRSESSSNNTSPTRQASEIHQQHHEQKHPKSHSSPHRNSHQPTSQEHHQKGKDDAERAANVASSLSMSEDQSPHKKSAQQNGKEKPKGKGSVDRTKFKPKRSSVIEHRKAAMDDDEHLGDDFLAHKWDPPSILKARKNRSQHMLRNGDADILETDVTCAPDLAIGANLYFLFLKEMCKYFLVGSLLSIPSIVFSYYGHGIKLQDQDALGLYRFSIGNIGYDPESPNYLDDAKCLKLGEDYGGTCLHFDLQKIEISTIGASYIITACEILTTLFLYYFLSKLKMKCDSLEEETSGLICKASDFAIQIKDIPADVTAEELTIFFSQLYQLDKRDFRGRPPVENCKAVHSSEFQKGEEFYLGTWVAECSIHKRIGKYITAFKEQQYILDELYHYKSKMKMYHEGTAFAPGKNLKEFKKAEEKMRKWQSKFDDLTRSVKITAVSPPIFTKSNSVVPVLEDGNGTPRKTERSATPSSPAGGSDNKSPSVAPLSMARQMSVKTATSDIDADSICAFLVFQNTESFARVLEDYQRYSMFPFNFFYPKQMLFRGVHKLTITKAAEPDEIVWENLEVSKVTKFFRRSFTNIATFILLLICFVIILQSTIYKEKFNKKIPDTSLCDTVIPSLFSDTITFPSGKSVDDLELMRPTNKYSSTNNTLHAYDKKCEELFNTDSFYGVYTYDSSKFYGYVNPDKTGVTLDSSNYYSFDACSTNGICPTFGEARQCPCISTSSDAKCKSETCATSPSSSNCVKFDASVIGACYCMDILTSALESESIVDAVDQLRNANDPHCEQFFKEYAIASSIKYLAIFVTILVNMFLPYFLQYLTSIEAHNSHDHITSSLIYKVFIPTFFNMAILVLIASGRIDGQPSGIKPLMFFQGSYEDFDPSWYGNIGTYFVTTFIVQAIGPIVSNLYEYFVYSPLVLWWHRKKIEEKRDSSIIRQVELNKIFVGEVFTFHGNQALLLALFFFAMVYSPGLPIISLTAFLTFFVFYWLEKMMLLRFSQRPRKCGNEIMRKVLNLCFIALFLRLAIACWMYGNPYVLAPNFVKTLTHPDVPEYIPTTSYELKLNRAIEIGKEGAGKYTKIFGDRLLRPNVFFLLLFLLVFLVFNVVKFVLSNFPVLILLQQFYKRCCKRNEVAVENEGGKISQMDIQRLKHPLRNEVAPYTGIYYKYVIDPPKREWACFGGDEDSGAVRVELSNEDVEDGWRVEYKTPYKFKMKIHHSVLGGKHDYKNTWEVINDHGCNSYNIERVPEYEAALKGIKEALDTYKNSKNKSGEVEFA